MNGDNKPNQHLEKYCYCLAHRWIIWSKILFDSYIQNCFCTPSFFIIIKLILVINNVGTPVAVTVGLVIIIVFRAASDNKWVGWAG